MRRYIRKAVEWLQLPEIKNISKEDAGSISSVHARIIREKPFLRKIYIDFYNRFKKAISGNSDSKLFVELGSGGGFIKETIPTAVTSDIIDLPAVDKHFSALDMPFEDNTVDAFFMLNVLHHVNDTRSLFKELDRCLKFGGKIVMIEPANTLWSRFIYRYFHHEQFDTSASLSVKLKPGRRVDCSKGWGFEEGHPLFSANGAIPWIVFYRDRDIFKREFPSLDVIRLEPHTPFRYLVSGGVSLRQLLPSFTYDIVNGIEIILSPLNKYLGMFLTIEINKKV